MDISYEKFIGALQAIHGGTLSGDDMVTKFCFAVDKLMPADLLKGRFKMLGGLLASLGKDYVPLLGSDYFSKETDLRRLEQGIHDVLETVDYVLQKMASEEEGIENVVRDTLMTLRPRIDKMAKMKSKFVFTAIRPVLKQQVIKAASLPGQIDECLGRTGDPEKHYRDLERDIKEIIVSKEDSLIPQLYRLHPKCSANIQEHREQTSHDKLFRTYLKAIKLVIRNSRDSGQVSLEGLSESALGFLEDGSLNEIYWKSFQERHKNKEELKQQLEDLILNYSVPRRIKSQKEKFSQEYGFFNLCDWLEWSISMSVGLPMMLTARKSLTLYRNLVIDMLQQRDELFKEIKTLDDSDEALEKLWAEIDQQMIASVRTVTVKSFLPRIESCGADTASVITRAEKLRMIHQLLSILEQEMVRVSANIDRQLAISLKPKGRHLDDIGSTSSQIETLFNRCILGVKSSSFTPAPYSPFAYQWTVRISEDDVLRQLGKIFSIFPNFKFPLQTFSFKKPLTYKVKDFSSDFTPQNFASRIRALRQEFTENSDPYKKLKLLLLPGLGSGCYDDNSQTLLVPSFRKDTDHDSLNFLMAVADYLMQTRPAMSPEVAESLFERLKRLRTLPPQLTPRHHLHLLAWSTRELLRLNESREAHGELKALLITVYESSPEVCADSDLDDAILGLLSYRNGH